MPMVPPITNHMFLPPWILTSVDTAMALHKPTDVERSDGISGGCDRQGGARWMHTAGKLIARGAIEGVMTLGAGAVTCACREPLVVRPL